MSCANEETPSSVFIAQEAAGKRQNLRAVPGICVSWGGDKAKVSRSRVESLWLKIPSPPPLHLLSVTQRQEATTFPNSLQSQHSAFHPGLPLSPSGLGRNLSNQGFRPSPGPSNRQQPRMCWTVPTQQQSRFGEPAPLPAPLCKHRHQQRAEPRGARGAPCTSTCWGAGRM